MQGNPFEDGRGNHILFPSNISTSQRDREARFICLYFATHSVLWSWFSLSRAVADQFLHTEIFDSVHINICTLLFCKNKVASGILENVSTKPYAILTFVSLFS